MSVGSLYQYFPNKAAILFRLQSDEWRQTSNLLRAILEDKQRPPLERLRILTHAFLASTSGVPCVCPRTDVRPDIRACAGMFPSDFTCHK